MLLLDCMLRYWTYCSGSTRRRSVRHEKTTVQVLMCVHWCRFVFGVTFVNDFFLHQFWKGKCDGQLCRPNVMVSCAGQMWWSVVQAKCDSQLCRPNVTVSCAGQMWWSVVQAKCDGQLCRPNQWCWVVHKVVYHLKECKFMVLCWRWIERISSWAL